MAHIGVIVYGWLVDWLVGGLQAGLRHYSLWNIRIPQFLKDEIPMNSVKNRCSLAYISVNLFTVCRVICLLDSCVCCGGNLITFSERSSLYCFK